jgi:hypothetical protein
VCDADVATHVIQALAAFGLAADGLENVCRTGALARNVLNHSLSNAIAIADVHDFLPVFRQSLSHNATKSQLQGAVAKNAGKPERRASGGGGGAVAPPPNA